MINPCSQCIVNPMCKKYCDELIKYIEYKTPGIIIMASCAYIIPNWIRETILNPNIKEVYINMRDTASRIYDKEMGRRPALVSLHVYIKDNDIIRVTHGNEPKVQPILDDLFERNDALFYTQHYYFAHKVIVGKVV